MKLLSLNRAACAPLQTLDGVWVQSAIRKRPIEGAVAVGLTGLDGDEQADLTVHGGLSKAVYAYPSEHMAFWRTQRQQHGVSLFDEALPPGFVGENLTLQGLLETQVWVGDTLHFPDCVLRVTEPRQPCHKFNAVMGFAQASKAMAQSGFCGFYLAVQTPGTLQAGQTFELRPGPRSLGVAQAFAGKRWKHLR